jgi:hypothetical protein
MIIFKRRRFWQTVLYRLWPPYRKAQDKAIRDGIKRLVKDPSLPCQIEDEFIPDGYGTRKSRWNIEP